MTLNYPVDGLELLAPYVGAGQRGPDLLRPRPHLRIVPSKVTGEPHIAGTRLTTPTIAALGERGLSPSEIAEMYEVDDTAVTEALDLERDLAVTA